MNFGFPQISVGVNITIFFIVVGVVIFLYLLMILFQNSFISFGPVAIIRFVLFVVLLVFFIAFFIVGDTQLILETGSLDVLFLFLFVWRVHKRKKYSKAQQTMGVNRR